MTKLVARPDTIWTYQFRIVLLGDSTVGKSALLQRFTDGSFCDLSDPTVGVDFYSRLVEVGPSSRIRLQLWDTAGQERFRSITRSYYHDSVGALLVYDITNRDSFNNVHSWMEEALHHVAPRQIIFVLVGQKKDLSDQRKVSTEEANAFATLHNMPFIEVSAKDGTCVEKAFLLITENIYRSIESGEINVKDGWSGVTSGLVPDQIVERNKCKC